MSREEIDKICNRYGIHNITINNGLVDVNGNVRLVGRNLTQLPVRFGQVNGDFKCERNLLTTLEGAPHTVGGDFLCYMNKLTSLEHCPKNIGGSFLCTHNKLTSLVDVPDHLGGVFRFDSNPIAMLFTPTLDLDFLRAFRTFKVIDKDGNLNEKRYRYIHQLFNTKKRMTLKILKRHWNVV